MICPGIVWCVSSGSGLADHFGKLPQPMRMTQDGQEQVMAECEELGTPVDTASLQYSLAVSQNVDLRVIR